MTRTVSAPETSITRRPLSGLTEQWLQEVAARYILAGPDALTIGELALAQEALTRRIVTARDRGLSPRDVLVSLLHPLFVTRDHCRCPSCQRRCLVCKQTLVLKG